MVLFTVQMHRMINNVKCDSLLIGYSVVFPYGEDFSAINIMHINMFVRILTSTCSDEFPSVIYK